MRFALASYLLQGRDINLDVLRIEGISTLPQQFADFDYYQVDIE